MKLTEEQKKERAEARRIERKKQKAIEKNQAEKNQPRIDTLTLTIQWKKSRTWGSNPHLTAEARFKDGQALDGYPAYYRRSEYTAGGCGYDKESTVIADAFNQYLKYKLHEKRTDETSFEKPYGISYWTDRETGEISAHYDGGIGTDCYYDISKYIGGTFEKIASGKDFDVYRYTDLN